MLESAVVPDGAQSAAPLAALPKLRGYAPYVAQRQYVGVWDDAIGSTVSVTCGWCATAVEMARISPTVELERGEFYPAPQRISVAAGFVCPRDECHSPSLIGFDFYEQHGKTWAVQVTGQLPRGKAQPMDGLPAPIESVRREAWSAHYGGDNRAAVVMARAAVQRAVRTLGGAGRDLYNEIDSLWEQGRVTNELKEWAHEVRLAAREAAHPEELGDVEPNETRESLDFMDDFLRFAVALPKRREAKKGAQQEEPPAPRRE